VPAELLDTLIETVFLASILSLVSVGFVVMFRATGVVSFAQGYLMLLGAVIYYYFAGGVSAHGWRLFVGLPVTAIIVGLVGVLSYRLLFARLAGGEAFMISVATIGLGIFIQTICIIVFGSTPVPNAEPSSSGFNLITSVSVPWNYVIIFVTSLIFIGAIFAYLFGTQIGLSMRAVASRPLLAAQSGINVRRVSAIAWGLGGAAAALAGIGYSWSALIDPVGIPDLGLVAFPVLILGGLDSIGGAVIGSCIIALVESATITWINGETTDVIVYALMIIVIMIRPTGLFGSRELTRL
jgi:branched-chain amino acid transport system permease protein